MNNENIANIKSKKMMPNKRSSVNKQIVEPEKNYYGYSNHATGAVTCERNTSQKGLEDGWTRATFIIKEQLLEKIKHVAYWERRTVKSVIGEALEAFFKRKK